MGRDRLAKFLLDNSGWLTFAVVCFVALSLSVPAGELIADRAQERVDLLSKAEAAESATQQLADLQKRVEEQDSRLAEQERAGVPTPVAVAPTRPGGQPATSATAPTGPRPGPQPTTAPKKPPPSDLGI